MPRVSDLIALVLPVLAGCETTALAPGADKVRLTSNPSDVANCKAVGNLAPPKADTANVIPENVIRDQTIGFGGNTAFVTVGAGIAYQCP